MYVVRRATDSLHRRKNVNSMRLAYLQDVFDVGASLCRNGAVAPEIRE